MESMDSLDNFRERFEALEQQTEQLKHHTEALEAHTHTIERRLRLWRGMACGLLILGLVSLPLSSGTANDQEDQPGLAQRVAALEDKLVAVTFDSASNELVITKANLRIVNGKGTTDTTNGLGNLIVGYNEPRPPGLSPDNRTGSHNVAVGKFLNFSSFGGLVVGLANEISGQFASVTGGDENVASGNTASVCGGALNTANGVAASVCGGRDNIASAAIASVCGGQANTASEFAASVSGGFNNLASGLRSSVSGGRGNIASANFSSVSGGANRSAPAQDNWAAGSFFANN